MPAAQPAHEFELGPGRQAGRGQAALRGARRSHSRRPSHPAMAVNLDACIQCTRCVRACREEQVNDVIGMAFRGDAREDRVRPRRSDGRFHLRGLRRMRAGLPDRRADAGARVDAAYAASKADRQVDSVCPYCGVGCQLTYHVKDNKIVASTGRDGPANHEPAVRQGPLRLRLRAPPAALTKPLIRKEGVPKMRTITVDPANWSAFPRGDLGRGAGSRRGKGLKAHPRRATARRRWPVSARPRARTKRPICSRSWCAPASAPTTSITARGSVPRLVGGGAARRRGSGAVSNQVNDVAHAEVIS
jgi:formate dehydrogenase major subunit